MTFQDAAVAAAGAVPAVGIAPAAGTAPSAPSAINTAAPHGSSRRHGTRAENRDPVMTPHPLADAGDWGGRTVLPASFAALYAAAGRAAIAGNG